MNRVIRYRREDPCLRRSASRRRHVPGNRRQPREFDIVIVAEFGLKSPAQVPVEWILEVSTFDHDTAFVRRQFRADHVHQLRERGKGGMRVSLRQEGSFHRVVDFSTVL